MARAGLLAVVLAALAAPVAAAQALVPACERECLPQDADVNGPAARSDGPVRVVLFAHNDDFLSTAPLTTQLPDASLNPSIEQSFITPTLRTRTGTAADLDYGYDIRLAPTPGRITVGADGRFSGHHYWTTDEIRLAPGPIVVYLYLAPDASPGPSLGTGAVARLRVEATWEQRLADASPRVLAHGVAGPFELAALAQPDEAAEVRIAMTPWTNVIPNCRVDGGTGCTLRLRIVQAANGQAEVAQRDWRLRSGVAFPWRLILPVEAPLRTHALTTHVLGAETHVAWSTLSAFGAYDIDPEGFRLRVVKGDQVVWEGAPTLALSRTDPHQPLEPTTAHWTIQRPPAADGGRMELLARNLQGTYELVERRPWPNDPLLHAESVPAPGLALLLLALLPGLGRRQTH